MAVCGFFLPFNGFLGPGEVSGFDLMGSAVSIVKGSN